MILPPLCSAFDKSRLFAYNVRTLSIKEMIAKNMLKEFKEFAMRGNIMDLAVGVIIGGSFQKIVTSLVNDMIMPIISVFTGKIDFSTLAFQIGDVSIKYGAFLTTILDFLIIAFSIFLFVRYANKLNKKWEKMKEEELKKLEKKGKLKRRKTDKEEAKAPTTKTCPYCFSEINIKATRCPNCTSELETSENEA